MANDLRLPCANCGHFDVHDFFGDQGGCPHQMCTCNGKSVPDDSPEGRYRAACEEALRQTKEEALVAAHSEASEGVKRWAAIGAAAENLVVVRTHLVEVYLEAQKTEAVDKPTEEEGNRA